MGVLRLLMQIPRKIKKIPKKLKRIPKQLLRTPKRAAGALASLWELLIKAASPLQFLPLDTFSGKALAATEILFFGNVLLTILNFVGRWQEIEILLDVTNPVLVEARLGLVLLIGIFLVSYPLDQRGMIESALVAAGVRQFNRTSAWVHAAVTSIAVTVPLSYFLVTGLPLPSWDGDLFVLILGIPETAIVAVITLVLSGGGTYWLLQRLSETYIRDELAIVDVSEQSDDSKGLVIRNDSDSRVSLEKAKVEDSLGEEYTVDNGISLRPGEKRTLDLPPEFKLQRTEYEVPTGLDLLYDETRNAKIFARTGDTFILEWDE